MNEANDKISRAVENCLAYVIKFESSVPALSDYLPLLKLEDGWSDDELAEVHRRVIDSLAKRASQATD